MQIVEGGCHCGNIAYRAALPKALAAYVPRACDCGFCVSHGAAYVSDRAGSLVISIADASRLSRYRQGSGLAAFLICRTCGVLVGVCYEDAEGTYGAINVRSARTSDFAPPEVMHLGEMTDEARIQRWKRAWFPAVGMRLGTDQPPEPAVEG